MSNERLADDTRRLATRIPVPRAAGPDSRQTVLIVNADDFGLAECVNRGIVRAHLEGIVTSTTLLANGPAFRDAVARLAGCPRLGVGVHLNLARGRPLSPPESVRDLLGPDGRFAPARLFAAAADGRRLAQAETEYEAQIARLAAAGIKPTHIDFEQHHGRRPALYALARRLAARHNIPALRFWREPCWWAWRRGGWPGWQPALRAAALRVYARWWTTRGARGERFGDAPPPAVPDHFLGQSWIGEMDAVRWRRLAAIAAWPAGVVEIMTHPGEYDPDELAGWRGEIGESWIHPRRPAELAGVTDPRVVAAWRRLTGAGGPARAGHFGVFARD